MFILLSIPLALLLYCPIMTIICAITPWKGFLISTARRRNGRYTTLHLSIYDRVGHLSRRRAARFHRSFITTLQQALQQGNGPVYFKSHLTRPVHLKSMTTLLTPLADTYRWRCVPVKISRAVRTGIRLQILLNEWRWITVPDTGALVVIRPCKRDNE